MVLSITPTKKVIVIVVLHKRHVYREMIQISEGLEAPISFGVTGMCITVNLCLLRCSSHFGGSLLKLQFAINVCRACGVNEF